MMSLRTFIAAIALLATTSPTAAWAQNGLMGGPSYGQAYAGHAPEPNAAYPASYGVRPSGDTVRVDLSHDSGQTQTLSLPKGKSAVIDLPTDAQDVLVTDPKVANVVLATRRRIYVMGVDGGQTDAAFFDAAGRQMLRLNIRVDQDTSALADTLNRILPGSSIRVDAVNANIVLSGEVADPVAADKALRLAQGFVAKPEQIINMMSVAESEQVMLKVRIVEVNRSIIKQLGFNLNAVIGQVGSPQYLLGTAATYGINGTILGGLTGSGYTYNGLQEPELEVPCAAGLTGTCYQVTKNAASGASNYNTATTQTTAGKAGAVNQASALMQAFESVGLVRTLAEPNLTAVSGESAHFLVGGEFPVPVGEDSTGRVTVDFKQYGVGLGFTPVVLSKGRISLKLSTEVSEITNTGAFTLSTSSTSGATTSTSPSLVVPGLNVRRAETVVELPSGQSMMIAGLLQSVNKETLDSLPGLMQVPVLGTLFRSRDYQQGETELVIIITPYLVKPTAPGQLQTPADGLIMANDLETNLLGKLNKSTGSTPPKDKTYQGPIGYVVE
jgi:pilus assembly protein CpaC